jgi:uncharacterized membrane protein YeaQ/YmgE (transglycosylase-associated protein family)
MTAPGTMQRITATSRRAVLTLPLAVAAGCNPNLDVDGALVPAWLTAAVIGIVGAVMARVLFMRWGIDRHLWGRPTVYLSVAVTVSCLAWVLLFRY